MPAKLLSFSGLPDPAWELLEQQQQEPPLQLPKERRFHVQNQNELKCDGCGQQFTNRNDLEKHRQTCAAVKAKAGSGQQGPPRTQGAGGGHNPQQ